MMLLLFSLSLLSDSTCLSVDAARITAGDLTQRMPAFSVLAPETPLANSPLPGARRDFTPAQLAALAARFGLTTDPTSLTPICIFRPSAQTAKLDWQLEVQRALSDHFQFSCGKEEIRILTTRLHLAPQGQPHWSRSGLRYDSSRAAYVWRVELRTGEEAGTGAIEFQLRAQSPRLLTRKALAAGHILQPGDIEIQLQPARPELPAASIREADLVGRALRRPVAAGVAIEAQQLKVAPVVQAGQNVEVISRAGQALVRTSGIARNRAAKGDPVLVWQPEAKRLLRTIATGPNAVEISTGKQ